ncbi:hypothetical protein F4806DRAFT_501430 [Annulohypoxylon nitens]|nr:hypothetical protein F4806DRAFT_501430 [Annulohypoxylon nitens]
MESKIEKYTEEYVADVRDYIDAKKKLEARLDRPILLILQFVYRDEMPILAKPGALERGLAPYTHEDSKLECFPWNLSMLFGTPPTSHPENRVPLFPTRRDKTMRGPRNAKLYPRYDDDGIPVDWHFLENYHYRTIERLDPVPFEHDTVWWPNIVVRLEEVYHVMEKLNADDPADEIRFFGVLSRPYVQLQEYWLLIDDKHAGRLDAPLPKLYWERELGDIDEAYRSEDVFIKESLEVREHVIGEDTIMKTPGDLIGIETVDQLSDRNKRRLRKVAQCLRGWGSHVVPRVVRWSRQHEQERNQYMPPTLFELVDQMDSEES